MPVISLSSSWHLQVASFSDQQPQTPNDPLDIKYDK